MFSPYQFGWNNPIRFNDPDGKCPECKTARQKPFDGEVYRTTGGADYVYGKGAWTRQGGTLNEVTVTAQKPSLLEKGFYRGKAAAEDAWNSPLARMHIPDIASIGVGFTGIAGIGGGTSMDVNWVMRGPDASIFPTWSTTQTLGAGMAVDLTINFGGYNYLGSTQDIQRVMIQTNTPNGDYPTIWGTAGIEAGLIVGVTGSYTRTVTGHGIVGRSANIGIGFPSIGRGAGGISNTWILNK